MKIAIAIILNALIVGFILLSYYHRGFKAGCDYTEKKNKNVNSTLQNEEKIK